MLRSLRFCVPETAEALEAMGWSDMKALFASLFVDEIGAVRREGGDAHDRIRALSRDDKRVLRAALVEDAD